MDRRDPDWRLTPRRGTPGTALRREKRLAIATTAGGLAMAGAQYLGEIGFWQPPTWLPPVLAIGVVAAAIVSLLVWLHLTYELVSQKWGMGWGLFAAVAVGAIIAAVVGISL